MAERDVGAGLGQRQRRYDATETAMFAAIARSSQDAVVAKTLDGTVTAWNDGAVAVFGYTGEQMLGRDIGVTFLPALRDEERLRHARVAGGAAESGFRCTRVGAGGRSVELIMTMSPVRDENGQVVGVASISRPVSEAEQAEARFAAVLDAAPDAVLCVDSGGRIITVNTQAMACFGYSREELVGAEVEKLLPEAARVRHLEHRRQFADHPVLRPMHVGLALTGRRRDGSTFPVEVSLAPATSGPDALVIAVVRDVSEQRALQAAARENESRLLQLAERVNTLLILMQLDPPIYLYVSPRSRQLLGIEPAQLLAEPDLLTSTVHPADRERVAQEYLRPSRAGLPARSELRMVRPDGGVRWVRAVATPVPNPQGAPQRTVIAIDDITDEVRSADALREAETAARLANEAKNQFLSRMSHELRTPLNAVLGFGQLLSRQLAGTEYADQIGYVLKGGRHLLELINDVLDIARIESGQMSVSLEPVPLPAIVEESLQLMQPLASAAAVSLETVVGSPACLALADRQRLRQILLNLISNAIKYNHSGGRVWVEWATTDQRAVVSVRDDGPGIAQEVQARLFTPFDRLGAESSGVEGTGIGLALTRSLAQLMGGTVSVSSAEGEGSCFTVTLPAAPTGRQPTLPADAAPDTTSVVARQDMKHRVLLYIEDNEPNVRVIEHLLRLRNGWHLMHAALGRLGLDLARAHRPDLILLDVHLPDLRGRDVLIELAKHPDTRTIPVVIVTADASVSEPRNLLAAGAQRLLTKPLDVDEMLAVLDQVDAAKDADGG